MDFNKCEGCPIDGEYEPYEPHVNEDAQFVVVVDRIYAAGAKAGRELPPATGKEFLLHMNNEGFVADQFTYHPYTLCPYDDSTLTNKEQDNVRKHCRAHMLDLIERLEPDAVLATGAEATKQALGRNVKITHVRGLGQKAEDYDTVVMPILHPGMALRYPEQKPALASDVAAFGRLVDADYCPDKAGEVEAGELIVLDDLQVLLDMDPDLISFDMETTGLDWHSKGMDVRSYNAEEHRGMGYFKPKFQILCMSFTVCPNKGYVLFWDQPDRPATEEQKAKLRNQLRELLCHPKRTVIGHNVKFDAVGLWMKENIRFKIGGDSLMLAAIHDENAMDKSLAAMTKIHAPDIAGYSDWFDAQYDKGRMWEVPWKDMVPYAGGDTIAAYKVHEALYALVAQDKGNLNYYHRVSLPGLNSFASIETRGMYVDDEVALPEFQRVLTEDVEERRKAIMAKIPDTIKRKQVATYTGTADPLSLTRAGFLLDILFDHPDGLRLKPQVFTESTERLARHRRVPSVSSKTHMPYFFETEPLTVELAEYTKLHSLLTKNVISFKKKYLHDGKVRPTYSLTTAKTRRSASRNPNGQNFPNRGEMARVYQSMFPAPEGYYVISVDLSQAEIRVAGEMAADKVITHIYRTGGDIHKATAAVVMGLTDAQFAKLHRTEQSVARQKAKAVNFGFLYGMGWRRFIGYAKTDYGVEFTEIEAKRIRAGFFKKYPGLERWHNRMRELVKRDKQVRSLSGLVRHLPMIDSPEEGIQAEAGRQAINSPVQEFASSLGVIALGRMEEEVDPEYLQPVGFIHDALVAYVRKEHVAWGMGVLKYYLENAPLEEWFGLKMNIPIVAEPSFGLNMGNLIELPTFSLDEDFDFWNEPDMLDKDGNMLLDVPAQETPPDDGWPARPPYTDWQYRETYEDVQPVRVRRVRAHDGEGPRVTVRRPSLQSISKSGKSPVVAAPSRRRRADAVV